MSVQIQVLQPVIHAIEQSLVQQLDEQDLIRSFLPQFKKVLQNSAWLDADFKQPHPQFYQQYLLYLDPEERFSIVSFVWGPGQKTPIHNHEVWGAIGVLEGAEVSTAFKHDAVGLHEILPKNHLVVGDIDWFSPASGDIHAVENAFNDQVSISIHIYGANIGKIERLTYQIDGTAKKFISGYSNS